MVVFEFVDRLEERLERLRVEDYKIWAADRDIATATRADWERFDDETRRVSDFMDKASGLAGPNDLARRIGARLDELSRAALEFGCDDSTVAALKGAAALLPDISDGRASLSNPETWMEARHQANEIFQGEAIAGIPLHRAWDVALDRLELAAKEKLRGGRRQGASAGRRRPQRRAPTEKQLEALKVVGECEQNWAEAARRLKKNEKTIRQLYASGLRNAGKLASALVGRPSTRTTITDRRGQSIIAGADDGPASIGPRPKVERDRR